MATLPGAWHYRVSAGTGWPCVSIPWLGEMGTLMGNFYLSVAVCKIIWADLSLRYTRMLLGHYATNTHQHTHTLFNLLSLLHSLSRTPGVTAWWILLPMWLFSDWWSHSLCKYGAYWVWLLQLVFTCLRHECQEYPGCYVLLLLHSWPR